MNFSEDKTFSIFQIYYDFALKLFNQPQYLLLQPQVRFSFQYFINFNLRILPRTSPPLPICTLSANLPTKTLIKNFGPFSTENCVVYTIFIFVSKPKTRVNSTEFSVRIHTISFVAVNISVIFSQLASWHHWAVSPRVWIHTKKNIFPPLTFFIVKFFSFPLRCCTIFAMLLIHSGKNFFSRFSVIVYVSNSFFFRFYSKGYSEVDFTSNEDFFE